MCPVSNLCKETHIHIKSCKGCTKIIEPGYLNVQRLQASMALFISFKIRHLIKNCDCVESNIVLQKLNINATYMRH